MSCRRARGFESKRTNEPPTECRGCEVRPRLALALRGLSWFIPTSHTQHATCHGSPTAPSSTTRGASDPRFRLGRFGPLKPATWSETWYGPGTRLVPFRRLRCLAHSDGCVPLGAQLLKERRRARVRGPADGRSEPAQDGRDFAGLCGRAHHRGRTGAPVGPRTRFTAHPHPPSIPSNNCGHGGWVWGAWFGLKVRCLLK